MQVHRGPPAETFQLSRRAKRRRLHPLLVASLFLVPGPGKASEPGDVLIVAGKRAPDSAPLRIDEATIEAIRPVGLDDLVRALPSTAISINSRGESIASVRGRNEREATILYDGVPLNDPWDQRIDLQLLPGDVVASLEVNPAGAVRAGSASVIRLQSPIAIAPSLDVETGSSGYRRARISVGARGEGVVTLGSLRAFTRDAVPLSSESDLPYSQFDPTERTNSDREQLSGVGIVRAETERWTGQAFVIASDATYGVPPESHLDPAIAPVRFWRVPDDRKVIAAASSQWSLPGLTIGVDGWHHHARRTTESYPDDNYATVDGEERGKTSQTGGAFAAHHIGEALALSAGGRVDVSEHRVIEDTTEKFRRRTTTLWIDGSLDLDPLGSLTGGLRREGYRTLDSGGRERGADLFVWTGQAGLSRSITEVWRITAAGARLGRLPSQRELYGEALGRFLVNTDLRPETRLLAEVTLEYTSDKLSLALTPFVERSENTIG